MLPISNPIFHVVNTQTFSISHAFCTNREFCDVCCSAIHFLCPRNSSAKSPPHWTTILGGEKLSWTEQEIAFTSICDTNSWSISLPFGTFSSSFRDPTRYFLQQSTSYFMPLIRDANLILLFFIVA